ncbi:MAG: hypothetical protein JO016_16590 [Actinobacteria bacterium]|nr:hypothetical protein [Actinomycetota bacterium]
MGSKELTEHPGSRTRPPEPPWGRVLADTVKLAVARRRFATLAPFVLVLAAVAGVALWLTGAFTASAAPAPKPVRTSKPATSRPAPVTGPQAQAARWIAGQVGGGAVIACDPGLCSVLQQHGVAAGRLVSLGSAASSGYGAGVLVVSPSADGQATAAAQCPAALIASFGTGAQRVEVCAAEPGGAATYQSDLAADLAARRSAGAQLTRNPHIRFAGADSTELRAGHVDARLLATLAALSSQYSFQVGPFGDTAPGGPVVYRSATITGIGHDRPAALAMVHAQSPPYVPARAVTAGPDGLSIEFAVPSPLGVLSPVLDNSAPPSASARGAVPLRSRYGK